MNKKRIIYLIFSIIAIFLGALMFVYAEIDDSPGGQLLGLLVAIIGTMSIIRSRYKNMN